MTGREEAVRLEFASAAQWRDWLDANHDRQQGAWVVYPRKGARHDGPSYEELIEEALCHGWIDSTLRPVDAERTSLYFCPRRPGGTWAATNKARVERLIADGRMRPAGLAAIERAQADGSWSALDRADALVLPDELARALRGRPGLRRAFDALPVGQRRQLIYAVDSAKRDETRRRRAARIVDQLQAGGSSAGG